MGHMGEVRPDVLAAMRECRLWLAADDEAVRRLVAGARVEDIARGTLLASEGDPAERMALVVSGRLRVYHLSADGRELTFETAEAGDPVGAVAALAGGRYPANVEAATDATVAWVDREDVFALMREQPDAARSIITDLAARVVAFTTVATGLAQGVTGRLATFLFQRSLEVGVTTPAGLQVDLGMSKAQLAAALGTVPETLSRTLGKLRDQGVIEVRASDVLVKDVGALARLGSGYSEG